MAKAATFHIPDDQAFCAAVGTVALRHAHLDHMLRLMIKSLADTTVAEARLATSGYSSAALRDEVRMLGKKSLGDGPAYIRLRALLTRAKLLSRDRNSIMHGICAREINIGAQGDSEVFGDAVLLDEDLGTKPLPTNAELLELAEKLQGLVDEMNGFRLHGFGAPELPDRRNRS